MEQLKDVVKESAHPILFIYSLWHRAFYSHGWKMAAGPPGSVSTFEEEEREILEDKG